MDETYVTRGPYLPALKLTRDSAGISTTSWSASNHAKVPPGPATPSMSLARPFRHVGDLDGSASVVTTARRWKAVRAYLSPTIAVAHWALVPQRQPMASFAPADNSNFLCSMPQNPTRLKGPPKSWRRRRSAKPEWYGSLCQTHFSEGTRNAISVYDMQR